MPPSPPSAIPIPPRSSAASRASGISATWSDPFALLRDADIDAVIIATPNRFHRDLAVKAVERGLHVLCEKPLAMTVDEARQMVDAAERACVRHMTAFTYRFVPAMRYLRHLVTSGAIGTPWHFRAQRFQDWGRRAIGWRQRLSEAGTGEVGDMLSHRLDFAHHAIGPIARVTAQTHQIWPTRLDDSGQEHASDTEDWVGCLAQFERGTTGVFESVKTATGYAGDTTSRDWCEVNGSEGARRVRALAAAACPRRAQGRRLRDDRRAGRVSEDCWLAARSRRQSVSGVPLRSGLRVHRGDPRRPRRASRRSSMACARSWSWTRSCARRASKERSTCLVRSKGSQGRKVKVEVEAVSAERADGARSAARASRRVESSVGNGEFASFMINGISVQPSTTASQPLSFFSRPITR